MRILSSIIHIVLNLISIEISLFQTFTVLNDSVETQEGVLRQLDMKDLEDIIHYQQIFIFKTLLNPYLFNVSLVLRTYEKWVEKDYNCIKH